MTYRDDSAIAVLPFEKTFHPNPRKAEDGKRADSGEWHSFMVGLTRKRGPVSGSIAWHKVQWRKALASSGKSPEDLVTLLAQLSYENKQLRHRLEETEKGMVGIVMCISSASRGD